MNRAGCLAFCLCALLLFGCATKRYDLEPVRVSVSPAEVEAGVIVPENLSPAELFDLGLEAFSHNDRERALAYFMALVTRHPDAPQYTDAAYNAALIHHRRAEFEKAILMYRVVVADRRTEKDVLDARFRILDCTYRLEHPHETLAVIKEIRDSQDIFTTEDGVELDTREAVALFRLGKIDEAETKLKGAFWEYSIGVRRGDVINEIPGAMAAHYLGLVERARFDAVQLVLNPREAAMQRLEEKAQHLQAAQDWFLRSIKQDNAYWATASGHQIGRLFHDFYMAIRNVETPEELLGEPEMVEMYRCTLLDMVRVLLKKAMRIYAHTIDIGRRLHVSNDWTKRARQDMEEVQTLYLKDIEACEDVLPQAGAPVPGDDPATVKEGKPQS